MKELFGVKTVEAVLFVILGAVYVALQHWWIIAISYDPGGFLPSVADMNPVVVNNMAILLMILGTSLAYGIVGTIVGKAESPNVMAGFLMRTGVALMLFSSAGQIISVFIPAAHWTLPGEGIPVMRNLTIAVSVGMLLAGIGGNMVWGGGRREAFLAETGGKKKK